MSIRGLWVVVTAGASGIGRAIAETFAARGARVHVCDIEESFLAELAESSPGIGATRADVGDPHQVDRLFDEALARPGGLDALIAPGGFKDYATRYREGYETVGRDSARRRTVGRQVPSSASRRRPGPAWRDRRLMALLRHVADAHDQFGQ